MAFSFAMVVKFTVEYIIRVHNHHVHFPNKAKERHNVIMKRSMKKTYLVLSSAQLGHDGMS